MRKLIALLLGCALVCQGQIIGLKHRKVAAGGGGSGHVFTFVSSAGFGSSCTTSPCNITLSISSGNFVRIDYLVAVTGGSPAVTCIDSGGDTFTKTIEDSSSVASRIWGECYVAAATSSTTVGISISGGTFSAMLLATQHSYTGTGAVTVDQAAAIGSCTASCTTTITGGSLTTTANNELIAGPIFQTNASQAVTGAGGYTNHGNDQGNGSQTISTVDRSVTTTGSYAISATVSSAPVWYAYTTSYK